MYDTWEAFLEDHPDFADFDYLKELAYIRKVGSQYCVFSESGKKMGCYKSRPAAEKRLKQVEMFKHMKNGSDEEAANAFCYCASCGREFSSSKPCYQSTCPFCDEQDDIYELRGLTNI
jgi:hypothetical protein